MRIKKLKYVLVLALIGLLTASYFSYPLLGPDSGFYLANARDIYQGNIYFRDIAIAYNPLAIVILGLPFLFSDSPDPRWSLLINMLFIWLSAYILYRVLQTVDIHKKQRLWYALFFVLVGLMLDGSHLMLEPISVCFQLGGLLLYLNHRQSDTGSGLVFVGLLFALSFLSKQYGLFILAPVGLDILLLRKLILKKICLMAIGFLIPIGLFWLYLSNHGMDFSGFIKSIFGKGMQLDLGNGTGINYSTLTYLIGFGVFAAFNLYILFIPKLLFKLWRRLNATDWLYLSLLPFSLLVLLSASYGHYFLYVLPYAILAFAYLSRQTQMKNGLKNVAFLSSVFLMLCAAVFSFTGKQAKVDLQQQSIAKLSAEIPKGSKVYLDGISPAYYYLCDFHSIRLNRLGYTFPGYFYPKTIVGFMESGSCLIVSEGAFPSYRKYSAAFSNTKVMLGGQLYYILKKP